MDVFLIDSWDLKKQVKQIKFLRQDVSVSKNLFHLSGFSRHVAWTCYTPWIIFSDKLSLFEGNLFHMRGFHRQAFWTFNWKFLHIQSVFKMKEKDWQLMPYFSKVSLAVYGCSFLLSNLLGKKFWKACYKFFVNVPFALLSSSRFNHHIYFIRFCQTTKKEVPSLIRKEKFTCENCGTQTKWNNIVRHKKRC